MPNEKGLSCPLKNTGQALRVSHISFSFPYFLTLFREELGATASKPMQGRGGDMSVSQLESAPASASRELGTQEPHSSPGSAG